KQVFFVDADVEEPNGHLFLSSVVTKEWAFTVPIPHAIKDDCLGCGNCQDACAFHAILAFGDQVLVFPELCHSCGACQLVCEQDALVEKPHTLGTISRWYSGGLVAVGGTLKVGEARSTPLVEAVVDIPPADAYVVIDCPPGTSCPVMAAVRHVDLVVLVTEPTPFGLHDLRLTVKMCRALQRPVAAIVNRADLGDREVFEFLQRERVPILAEIPFEEKVARAYAAGEMASECSPSLRQALKTTTDYALGLV
ncbi:MAG: P-loop NTPase, partial [Proteobacteria bacterium]|nr:P-loop NTPase [Pseudomonadota bacterium]